MKTLLSLFVSVSAQFNAMLPSSSQSDFCNNYHSYTATLTSDQQGAYVMIDGHRIVRQLTATELADLSKLQKHLKNARVACN